MASDMEVIPPEKGDEIVNIVKDKKAVDPENGSIISKNMNNLELKCKSLAWCIIIISALFHVYRLFNHGKWLYFLYSFHLLQH